MSDVKTIGRIARRTLKPPPKLDLADWVQEHVHLPSSIAAHPGRMRLWPHQIEPARSMGAPDVERVSFLKSARVGYTALMVAALGHFAINDPCPVLGVLPSDDDCRKLMTGNIEPCFAESPALRKALKRNVADRDTLYSRRYPGGSLTLVSAGAPRNLRAHTARVLLLDEVDAFEVDVRGEGDPVALGERRTLTFANRKIIMGSTPVHESTSRILRAYEKSDQRIYECECPACHDRHELKWKDIHWSPDSGGADAHWACPSCGGVVEEADKPAFVSGGRWRATKPEVVGHHGYRISALVSLLPNAAWPKLAAEFLEAKKSPELLKTFINTVLGEAWRDDDGDEIDGDIASRREPFGLDNIPPEVILVTCGLDLQDDRVELTTTGWSKDGQAFVLAHEVVWGSPLDGRTWEEVDDLLSRFWRHPNGGVLRIDAAIVDSGDGGHTDAAYAFCKPRTGRRIFAGKGVAGFSRPATEVSSARHVRLIIIGVDGIKNQIMNRLAAGRTIRFSESLSDTWFDQLASERRVVRYTRGQPYRSFERISGKRAEALDCLVYSFAARGLVNMDLDRREADLQSAAAPTSKAPSVIKSPWVERWS